MPDVPTFGPPSLGQTLNGRFVADGFLTRMSQTGRRPLDAVPVTCRPMFSQAASGATSVIDPLPLVASGSFWVAQ